jgi:hypothetical protein
MEGLQPLHRRVAGIDVHRMLHVVTLLIEQADGSIERTTRQFGGLQARLPGAGRLAGRGRGRAGRHCRAPATAVRLNVEQIQLVSAVRQIGLGRIGLQGA